MRRATLGVRLAKYLGERRSQPKGETIMATPPPPTYTWELGIDWDLLPAFANSSFMPGGFLLTATSTPQRPVVSANQTIAFRIFDLSKGKVTKIESFTINPQIAVAPGNINPLQDLQPSLVKRDGAESFYFKDSYPCWETDPVSVTASPNAGEKLKFLLNLFVQATGNLNQTPTLRTFAHDPEMVVGPNM
jgi:hypothetical protein